MKYELVSLIGGSFKYDKELYGDYIPESSSGFTRAVKAHVCQSMARGSHAPTCAERLFARMPK